MTTEQGGAPSATAGGAPAPDGVAPIEEVPPHPAYVENAVAGALTDMYGFLPLSVRYGAAAAARAAVESWQRMTGPAAVPDPRDAELERLRGQLGDVCTALHNQLSDYDECGVFTRDHALYLVRQLGGRVRLRDMTIKAMQEMTRPSSLPDQRGIEIEQLRKRLAYDLGLPSDEVVNVPLVELLQRLKTMHMTALDEARSRNGDMRTEVEELETQRDEHVRAIREVMADCNDYAARLRDTDAAYAKVTAERDRLRQELDLIGEQRPKFQPEQRVRVGNGECFGTVHTTLERYTVEIDDVHFLVDLPPAFLTALPAEPRRWVAGDPEPEIGTTVGCGDGNYYTRRDDGIWYRSSDSAGYSWTWLTGRPAHVPLVEVVTTDGD